MYEPPTRLLAFVQNLAFLYSMIINDKDVKIFPPKKLAKNGDFGSKCSLLMSYVI
jgi:hypothetical protein